MNVAEAIAGALVAEGITLAAGIAGTHIGRLLNAVASREEISLMYCRQERAAFDMADGFARASGRPALVITDSGPAAANVMGGLVNSWGDSTPVLHIAGHTDISHTAIRDTKQIPFLDVFRPVSKWAAMIEHPDQVSELLRRAFMHLRSGRPGPVVLGMPYDVSGMDVGDFRYQPVSTRPRLRSGADPEQIEAAIDMIASAERPYLYAGAGVLVSGATDALVQLAELLTLPCATTLNGKSAFPENHALSLGIGGFIRARYNTLPALEVASGADLVIAVGCGFKHEASLQRPGNDVRLIQIDIEPEEINRSRIADVALLGDARLVLEQLVATAKARLGEAKLAPNRMRLAMLKALRERWDEVSKPLIEDDSVPINPFRVTAELVRQTDPMRTVVTHDAGTVRGTIAHHWPANVPRSFLGFGVQSSMGWSLGAAFGAKKAQPEKLVIAVIGEEAFNETALDIETSIRNHAPVLILVKNNATIAEESDGKKIGRLAHARFRQSPDVSALGRALGAAAFKVDKPAELAETMRKAIAEVEGGRTTILEVRTNRLRPVLHPLWQKGKE
jgi:acetolactate synthase-1/2/3 large subunit